MRITRDECRLFAELLNDIEFEWNSLSKVDFNIAKLSKDDFRSAMFNLRNKFKEASEDNRRNSEKIKSNDYSDLMVRITKKYKDG